MVSPAQSKLIDALLTPAQVGAQVSSAVAAKTLQAQQQQGAAVLKLLESASLEIPTPGDPLVAKATGLGGLLDVVA